VAAGEISAGGRQPGATAVRAEGRRDRRLGDGATAGTGPGVSLLFGDLGLEGRQFGDLEPRRRRIAGRGGRARPAALPDTGGSGSGGRGMTSLTRSGGSSSFKCGGCPGWPPGWRPVGFSTTGLGALRGLAEGGTDEFEELMPRRAVRSRTSASSSATRRSNSAMRASRSRHPGHAAMAMPIG
jgi:hypothetical protein